MTDTRAAFEAWFLKTRPSKHRPDFALREDGTYTDDHTQRHWWTWQNAVLADRERCARIASAAQEVTTGATDKIDYFKVPSHLMAALALALDEAIRSPQGHAMTTAEELREWAMRDEYPDQNTLTQEAWNELDSRWNTSYYLRPDDWRTFALLVACALEDDDADQA